MAGQFCKEKVGVFEAQAKKKGWPSRSLASIKKKAQRLPREVKDGGGVVKGGGARPKVRVVIRNEEGPSCSATLAGGPPPAARMENVVVPYNGGPLHQVQKRS